MKTPIHPGEVLKDEIKKRGVNAATIAKEIKVPGNRLSLIMQKKNNSRNSLKIRKILWH